MNHTQQPNQNDPVIGHPPSRSVTQQTRWDALGTLLLIIHPEIRVCLGRANKMNESVTTSPGSLIFVFIFPFPLSPGE